MYVYIYIHIYTSSLMIHRIGLYIYIYIYIHHLSWSTESVFFSKRDIIIRSDSLFSSRDIASQGAYKNNRGHPIVQHGSPRTWDSVCRQPHRTGFLFQKRPHTLGSLQTESRPPDSAARQPTNMRSCLQTAAIHKISALFQKRHNNFQRFPIFQ